MRLYFIFLSFFLYSCVTDENKSLTNSKNNQDAISLISEKIKNDITNNFLYIERAKINIEKNRYREALKDLMTANSLDSTVGENHFLLGEVLLGLVKRPEERITPKEAINNLKMASNYFYNSKNYGYKLALSYKNAGETHMFLGISDTTDNKSVELNRSTQLLLESIRVDATNPHTFILLGYVYVQKEMIEEAENCFNKSIELNPNNEEAFLQLGNLYLSKQDFDSSIIFYKKVLNINPKNRMAWNNLGSSYQLNGEFSNSQEAFHKIIDLGIKDKFYIDANYNLALMFIEDLKDYRNALNNYLIEIIRVNSNHYLALYQIAFCYESLGDVRNAEEYYRKTLEIKPNLELAKNRLEKIISDNKKYK